MALITELLVPLGGPEVSESVPKGLEEDFRRVGATHRSSKLPRHSVGGLHPPYNCQTRLLEQTLNRSRCRAKSSSSTDSSPISIRRHSSIDSSDPGIMINLAPRITARRAGLSTGFREISKNPRCPGEGAVVAV